MNEFEWNLRELNLIMKKFAQLMDGEFVESLQRLSQLQQLFPQWGVTGPMQSMGSGETIPASSLSSIIPNIPMQQIQQLLDRLNTTEKNVKKASPSFPIQMWENDHHIYVLAGIPGLRNGNEVKVHFIDPTHLLLQAKAMIHRPERNCHMIYSDFITNNERVIELSQPVSSKTYSTQYTNGLYMLILNKLEENIEISLDNE